MKITRTQLRRMIMREARLNEADLPAARKRANAVVGALIFSPVAATMLATWLVGRPGSKLSKEVQASWDSLDPRVREPIEAIASGMKALPGGVKDTAIDSLVEILQGLKSDN